MKMGRKQKTQRSDALASINEYIKEKRRKGLCEDVGCYNEATHWYQLGFGEKRYVCEQHFREVDEVYDIIARTLGWRYNKGVVLRLNRKLTSRGDE
jgi:hypothetical protein